MPFWSKTARRDDHAESRRLRCSFCNKDQNDVRKLIAGPTVFICDECVQVCVDIIADDTRFTKPANDGGDTIAPADTSAPADDSAGDSTVDCVMCQAAVPVSQGLTIPGRGVLCAECEDAVVLAVDNRWPADE